MINWKEYGEKWSRLNIKYYPGICLGELGENVEISASK
jgi:hypothetical protein